MKLIEKVQLLYEPVPKILQYAQSWILKSLSSFVFMQTHVPETKKPAYRWLGSKTIFENRFIDGSASLCDRNVPKKRAFGTELTNVNAKRNKPGCSSKRNGNQNTNIVIKQEQCDDVKPDVKNFASGSSTPAGTSESNDMGNNIRPRGRLGVIEALSTLYQPSYCNPGKKTSFFHICFPYIDNNLWGLFTNQSFFFGEQSYLVFLRITTRHLGHIKKSLVGRNDLIIR